MRPLTLDHDPANLRLISYDDKAKTRIVLAGFLLLLSFTFACQTQTSPDMRATDESTLRNLDSEWSKAAGAKDVDKAVSYYADDAIVMTKGEVAYSGPVSELGDLQARVLGGAAESSTSDS